MATTSNNEVKATLFCSGAAEGKRALSGVAEGGQGSRKIAEGKGAFSIGLEAKRGCLRDAEGGRGCSKSAENQREASAFVTFVLLHGFAQTPHAWDEVARMLEARGHRVVCPQIDSSSMAAACEQVRSIVATEASRGQGFGSQRSGSPGNGSPDGDTQRNVSPSASRFDGGQSACAQRFRVALVGYSMGGRVALEALCRYGADLQATDVILESAGLGPAEETARAAFATRADTWARELHAEGVPAFMDRWEQLPLFASQRAMPDEARARMREERLRRTAPDLAGELVNLGQHHQSSEAASLAALCEAVQRGVRVRYIAGELDAKYSAIAQRVNVALEGESTTKSADAPEVAREGVAVALEGALAAQPTDVPRAAWGSAEAAFGKVAAVAGASVAFVPGAGHNVHFEQPQLFVEILADFCG